MPVPMSTALLAASGAVVLAFAAVHIFIGRLNTLNVTPRSGWLSFAGGTAVAYVFLHILPELASHQREFANELSLRGTNVEVWIYALAMLGLAAYYGVERWAKLANAAVQTKADRNRVLWVHTGSFAVYNLLIGYLLVHREEAGGWSLALYAVAMGFHFMTTDHAMRRDHPHAYDTVSRWVLAASVLAGWALGLAIALPPLAIGCLFAFLAGGVVLNVLKEELPEERKSRFGPFLAGVIVYAVLLLVERGLA